MLKLFDLRWLMLVMLLSVAALPVRTQASTPTVVISEIAWAGSSISASDEWIELTNVSDTATDLSGWTLQGAGSAGANLVLPDGAQIEPHSTFVIANYEHTHANSALESAPAYVTATLSLPNGGFTLSLYDAGNAQIDVAGGSGSPFAGGSGSTGDSTDGRYTSMVRVDGLDDGSLKESWTDADTASGFKAGVEDFGTPGIIAFATLVVEAKTVVIPSEGEGSPSEETTSSEDPSVDEEPASAESVESVPSEPSVTILINEFVVDPHEGESEWIELFNASDEAIDLTGWTVEDATQKQTLLEGTLASGEYLLVDSPLGRLNNGADSILLKDAAGVPVDSIEYGTDELAAPKDGASISRGESKAFELTYTTTPGSENVIDLEKPEVIENVVEEVVVEDVVEEELIETDPTIEEPAADESVESVPSNLSETPFEIRISEFVVDPLGDGVEWIELFNAGTASVTLEGWTIEDESGKSTNLSAVTIGAESYIVVESPKGKLNNDGDSVILKDASGTIIESVVYGGDGYPVPKNGEALAFNGETFQITELTTPASLNFIFVALEEILEVEDNSSTSVIPPAHQSLGDDGSEASETEGSQANEPIEEVVVLKTLRFISLYPNASGSDEEEEYIVIENTGTETIDLLDWSIEDGSTKRFTFKESTSLASGATIQVGRPQSKITLNNGGDTLELTAPDGDVIDLVTYGNSAKGATYDLVNGTWMWSGTATVAESTATEPTVTESTTTLTPVATSTTKTVSNSTNSTNATYASTTTTSARVAQFVTIAQAKQKADGQKVIVKGVVTSAPGTFGSQIFYVQDETGGIQVYLYSGDFPELALGDVIQITGELSTSRGERRVKLASASGAVSASGTFSNATLEVDLANINESLVGMLATTQGQIQSIDTNKLVIEQTGTTLTIYLKSNPVIDAKQFERGDKIEVTGVLTSYDGELRLRPRFSGDITIIEETVVASSVTTQTSDGSSAGLILLITTMTALIALALWRYLPRRRLTPAAA